MSWANRFNKRGKKTPYQGERRSFGEYDCQCGRSWKSANSFANVAQLCKGCNTRVYAHNMKPLERPEGLDEFESGKEHPKHLCELCRQGYDVCVSRRGP